MGSALHHYDIWKTTPPELLDDSEEQTAWLESAAEQLVMGCDIHWKRRHQSPHTITADSYVTALQDHLNQRQIDGMDERDAFARLVLAARNGCLGDIRDHADYLLGPCLNPNGTLHEIALTLLRPLAADAVAAEREAHEDDRDADL